MKTKSYGKKIGNALKAIAAMHSDVSKLLAACDRLFPNRDSLFGTSATRDLTYSATATFWMASGVYRYWLMKDNSVAGITVMFHSADATLEQPILILGRIEYKGNSQKVVKEGCDPWHLWYGIRDWAPRPTPMRKCIKLSNPDVKRAIKTMALITAPLFSIEDIADVQLLFTRVGVQFPE